MHHFIYPSQDTFITNTVGLDNLNFGLDEILRVGTENIISKVVNPTTIVPVSSIASNLCVVGFSGSITNASLYGTASFAFGTISSSINADITTSYFTGRLTGSYLSASLLTGSSFTGSLTNFSGSFIGIFSGSVVGSLQTNYLEYFNGIVTGFTGKIISGSIVGVDVLPQSHTNVETNIYSNRALVQFDITSISSSVAKGDIINPQFRLKLNVAREFELPIKYNIYASPISESWVMGDGYLSDGGSVNGASWLYRDYDGGTPWVVTGSSYLQSLTATQSFNYQVGDINMDVTAIANAWISGTIPNNGFVLISSDEFSPTGSGMDLRFFSKDTNTIYEPILDVSWNDSSWSTGSVVTSSIDVGVIPAGLYGIVIDSASINGALYGGFTGFGNIVLSSSYSESYSSSFTSSFTQSFASGLVDIIGVNGLIISMSIVGHFSGSTSSSIVTINRKCQTCHPRVFLGTDSDYSKPYYAGAGDDAFFNGIDGQFPSMYGPNLNIPSFIQAGLAYMNKPSVGGQDQSQYQGHDIYGWGHPFNEFNQYDWTSDHVYQEEFGPGSIGFVHCGHSNCGPYQVTMSFLMGTLYDGTILGATFTSSLINGYILGYGHLVGSWNETMIDGTQISASYPFKTIFPTAMFVRFVGNYVNGPAFGSITNYLTGTAFNDYGVFDGVFTGGPLVGLNIHAPFSGSILNTNFYYTSSINTTASILSSVDFKKSFVTTIQNIPSSVKSDDLIRVNVFARPEFPIKNFNRQTQFTQFLTPQYLPSSSYYAIKDNETEQIILDFDQYTQLSCDSNGNYFMLDTTSFPQERYFRILIRTMNNGNTYTFDKGNIFKIVR